MQSLDGLVQDYVVVYDFSDYAVVYDFSDYVVVSDFCVVFG